MSSIEKNCKVKVLVLGDSGVGKSSFTHLLCHNQASKTPGYTIGCSVEIKLHDYKQGTPDERTYCVEVWDIGASKNHTSSRFIFYNNVNGIILVHDLTNSKSLQNLGKWLNDVLSSETSGGLASIRIGASNSASSGDDLVVPVLLVGTKYGLVPESKRANVIARSKYFADNLGCQDIHLTFLPIELGLDYGCIDAMVSMFANYTGLHSIDNVEPKYVAAGSGNAVQLSRFFDKAVEHTLSRRTTTSSGQSPMVDWKGSGVEKRKQGSGGRILGMKSD